MRRAFKQEKLLVGKIIKIKVPKLILLEKITFMEFDYLRRLSGRVGKIKCVYYGRGNQYILAIDLYDRGATTKAYISADACQGWESNGVKISWPVRMTSISNAW